MITTCHGRSSPCGTLTLKRSLAMKDGIMKTIKAFVERHPLLSFYALAFAITWGGLIMVVGGPSEILGSPEKFETRFGLVLLAWLAGPSVASILMTGLVHGRAGLRNLFARMTRWRVGALGPQRALRAPASVLNSRESIP